MNFYVSKPNKSVLVPYSMVKNLWPDADKYNHNGDTYAILPHDPRTQIRLRSVGIEIPAPILSYYDWNSGDGKTPFAIQKATAALVTSNQRSYVLSDMGTGKTRASLWAWHYLHQLGLAKKLLVVAPLSTLRFTWQHEITMLLPGVKSVVLHGDKKKRLKTLEEDFDIAIINHDGLKVIAQELYARADINFLILDELAVYRNKSNRAKLMQDFAQRFTWIVGMTGRPMPNQVTDVWGQAKILTPHKIPKYFTHAKTMLMRQIDQFTWVPKEGAVEVAYSWMQPSVRYSLDDVMELPPAIYRTIQVELTPEQEETYEELSTEYATMVENQEVSAANAAVLMGKLLQLGAGYVYTTPSTPDDTEVKGQYVKIDASPREDMLLEIIDESAQKLIVFAPWVHLIKNLSALMSNRKDPIDHAVIYGDTTHRERIFFDFQNSSRYKVLLAHPQVMAHGLTLTRATAIVWYSPITSLEIYEQANARIYRPSQIHKTQFLHFKASPVEGHVYSLLRRKQRVQDSFLAMLKAATKETID
jgi:SNF2 family DNA or RNA helicase